MDGSAGRGHEISVSCLVMYTVEVSYFAFILSSKLLKNEDQYKYDIQSRYTTRIMYRHGTQPAHYRITTYLYGTEQFTVKVTEV
jgi:hypothetical protein